MTDTPVQTYIAWLAEQVADPIAQMLLASGRDMPEVTHGAIDMGEMGLCYSNALERAYECSLDYCEGYATSPSGFPLQHAWCIDGDGNVYDPTWADGQHYWGVVLPLPTIRQVIRQTDVNGILCNLWRLEISEARQVLADIGTFQSEWWGEFQPA